jgi:hypothetical protein
MQVQTKESRLSSFVAIVFFGSQNLGLRTWVSGLRRTDARNQTLAFRPWLSGPRTHGQTDELRLFISSIDSIKLLKLKFLGQSKRTIGSVGKCSNE